MEFAQKQLELFRVQFDFTLYQALVLISVIFDKSSPTDIAEFSKIPRSKIYENLEFLEQKNFISKNSKGTYELNLARLGPLRLEAEQMMEAYLNFIGSLLNQVQGKNVFEKLHKDIASLLEKLGYRIEKGEQIAFKVKGELEKEYFEALYRSYLLKVNKPKYRIKPSYYQGLDVQKRIPDLITESPTTGIRTGIFLASNKDIIATYISSLAYSHILSYNIIILVTPSPLDSRDRSVIYNDHRSNVEINLVSYGIEEIEEICKRTDVKWSILKNNLVNLDMKQENVKIQNRDLIFKINKIFKDLANHTLYKDTFEDILIRMKNDLELEEQLLSQTEEFIRSHFILLEGKELFKEEELTKVEKTLENIRDKLNEKDKEILNFEDEIFSVPKENNPYIKFGYKLNPFSLWVPLEKPNIIINQQNSRKIMDNFLHQVNIGSEANLLLITGVQGVGKSHFQHYYYNKINEDKNNKSIAIKIQCKHNRDIVDLYPQITEGLKKILFEKGEAELMEKISVVISNYGTPRLIQDLMKLLRELNLHLLENGYKSLYLFIDELENSFPPNRGSITTNQIDMRKRSNVPQSILQLASLSMTSGLGFIVTIRYEDWKDWEQEIYDRIRKVEPGYIIKLNPLSFEDTNKFLDHRLSQKEFRLTQDNSKNEFSFEGEVVKSIWVASNGNPRKMLRMAGILFRKAIQKEVFRITSNLT